MAQYNHLPIYKASYDLLIELIQVTKNYPREYRYSIGEKMDKELMELIINIYKANSAKDKTEHIKNILENIQFINLFLRISMDLKILPIARSATFVEKVGCISRQATAWKSYQQEQ